MSGRKPVLYIPDRLPNPREIAETPECAILTLLEVALRLTEDSLIAINPHMCDPEIPRAALDTTARHAFALLSLADKVRATIRRYLHSLASHRPPVDPADDLPF